MAIKQTTRILNGIAQEQRLLPALEEGYFNVDEMSFEDLLTLSVEFASELKFYNSDLQHSGNWRSFLASNEIVIMANMINRNIDALRKKIQLPENQSDLTLSAIFFEVLIELDSWLVDLKRSESVPANELASQIDSMIRSSLRNELHSVAGILGGHEDASHREIYKQLSGIWEVAGDIENGFSFAHGKSAEQDSEIDKVDKLRRSSFEMFNALEHLKSICKNLLPLSLSTQSHDPAISLFITFLKLYKYAQDNVNSFSKRHLDYYYQEILKVKYKEKSLESVVLNFNVAAKETEVKIAAGTKFSCSKDDDFNDVLFKTTQDLLVSDAQVSSLYTLKYEREPMITPECDMNFVTKIHRKKLPISSDQESDSEQGWALFGGDSISMHSPDAEAIVPETGIAVASNTLFLNEGHRRIRLDLKLSQSMMPITHYLAQLATASSRVNFRESLFAFSLAWSRNPHLTNWQESVPTELSDSISSRALEIDEKFAHVSVSEDSTSQIEVISCVALLDKMKENIVTGRIESHVYFDHLLESESANEFKSRLGEFVIHCLLEDGSDEDLLAFSIVDRARLLGCEKSLRSINTELHRDRARVFERYFDSAFVIELTTETGWLALERYDVVDKSLKGLGLQVTLTLPAEAPAIVGCMPDIHGDQWGSQLPVMKLKMNSSANMNVHSLLDKYSIETVMIGVDVSGVRNIVAYNNISQCDPSKPFTPFGPMPTTSSYLALSAPEASKKNIESFQIHLHWGDLPKDEGGFDDHYSAYRADIKNSSFTTDVSILCNGSWQPRVSSQIQNAPLFSVVDNKPQEHQEIEIDSIELFKPVPIDSSASELDLGLKTRNGFVKLTLASPDSAFGHNEYPQELSQTIEKNSKAKVKKKKNLPKSPYTPLLNKIAIDYTASSTMSMSTSAGASSGFYSEKVFRIHPFGAEQIFPNKAGGLIPFFKRFDHDGNLLIGISATKLPQLLSLYFSLADDSQRESSESEIDHSWSYLNDEGWINFRQEQILDDGTKGFLCSGIVNIEMPGDITSGHSDMPDSCYWLKVSSSADSRNFCSLNHIDTHAAKLMRCNDDGATFDALTSDAATLDWKPQVAIPSLSTVKQWDPFFTIGKKEQRNHLITRISERIRHRSRAITPWDYERLILEEFPSVGKVLCLPNRVKHSLDTVPGSLLIVVTPTVRSPKQAISRLPKLSAVSLNEIHQFVSSRSPHSAHIEVINPSFERVQVRCTVVFENTASGGVFIDQLNKDIGNYLNPWQPEGYGLNFCQSINREDIYSYIYSLDYIKYVTDFSMLHITRDMKGNYSLKDTVNIDPLAGNAASVNPLKPWSLIVPLKHQYIETNQVVEQIEPNVTGIKELEIGKTFIIGGK